MSYVDIAIIAVVAFFGLLGLWKGVGESLIKLICFAGATVVAFILVDYVTGWLLDWDLTRGLLIGDGFSLRSLYYEAIGGEGFSATSGVMAHYVQPMIDRYSALGIGVYYGSVSLGEFVSLCMVYNSLTIVCWLIVYAVVRAIISLIGWILTKIFVREEKNAFSRIFGFIVGAVRGLTLVMILLLVSTVIFPFEWATGYTETVSNSILGNPVAQITYMGTDMAVYADPATEELMAKVGYKKLTFDEKKSASKTALDEYRAYLISKAGENGYSEANLVYMDAYIASGKAQIDAIVLTGAEATKDDFMAVVEVEERTKEFMAEIYTADQEAQLAQEKVDAKASLDNYYNNTVETVTALGATLPSSFESTHALGIAAINNAQKLGEAETIRADYEAQLKEIIQNMNSAE